MDRPDASGDNDNKAPSTDSEEPVTAHLELATLLLDEQWNDFMELWSTRNDYARQGELQRFNAWFEHRRPRPIEVRGRRTTKGVQGQRLRGLRCTFCFGIIEARHKFVDRSHQLKPPVPLPALGWSYGVHNITWRHPGSAEMPLDRKKVQKQSLQASRLP